MQHPLFTRLAKHLRAFQNDDKGVVTLETLFMFPLLFLAFLSMFSFFDAYRQVSVGQKAAFTISDMISRETNNIDDTYIDNALDLFVYLTHSSTSVTIRISVIYFDNADDNYYIGWSKARGTKAPLTDVVLQSWGDVLPVLPQSDALILVETWSEYKPPFRTGLDDTILENFIFTSPRFASQLDFTS